ncbi:MAG TPA: PQQ-binding-like beta-propeller repeat protein [Gemmataceae bacterium]|nr:PQQ-binding-like beta-propeller repeat protein [Gemmataceae bacterium]
MRSGTLLVLAGLLGFAMLARADDWLGFRGPGGLGISADKNLPVSWGEGKNLAWKTEMPGPGSSCPIVVGNKVFITCYSGYAVDRQNPGDIKKLKRHVLCLDRAKGKILWSKEIPAVQPEHACGTFLDLHGYASSTPVSDGKSVFVFFGLTGVLAFDLDGKELWKTSVGKGTNGWGSGTSPIVYKNLVIVNASVEDSSLIALDKKTGKEVWRAKNITESWSTPVLVKVGGQTELVVSGSRKILGFDPDTGKELWHADSFNWYVCPTVTAHEGVVYALQNSTCVAVKAGGKGDVTKTHTLWQKEFGDVVTSPVFHQGHIYWSGSTAVCLNAADGKVVYKERLKPNPDNFYAAPVLVDGKIYYVSRTKGTYVVAARPKFELLGHNTLDDSVSNTGPVVSNSQLLLRSDRFLYCVGKGN